MAENKNATPDNTTATPTPSGSSKKAPGEEMVDLFIPKTSKSDTARYLAVNGERILVKTNETVKVKRKFAEVYMNSAKQKAEADAFIENNTSI